MINIPHISKANVQSLNNQSKRFGNSSNNISYFFAGKKGHFFVVVTIQSLVKILGFRDNEKTKVKIEFSPFVPFDD